MSINIKTDKGWTEVVIDDNCGYEKFYQAAELLKKDLQIEFFLKLNDFDSLYWDFKYKGSELTLHYNIYMGISVFPKVFALASDDDNEKVIEIGEFLFEKLNSIN